MAAFDGGTITSDGGAVLLRQVDDLSGLLRDFAACFHDARDPDQIEHTVEDLLLQRVFGLALGYEDLNDHDELRREPLLATVVGKPDPLGRKRRQSRDRGKALAGKSTLNRLEWGCAVEATTDRYRRIAVDPEAVDRFFVQRFLDTFEKPPKEIILDVDATDNPLHGSQEGRFFHGYNGCYCYLLSSDTCRSTSSPAVACSALACGDRTSTPRREPVTSSSASSARSGNAGRECASWCGRTRALHGRR